VAEPPPLFSPKCEKVEMLDVHGLKPGTPNYRALRPVACSGLKPSFIKVAPALMAVQAQENIVFLVELDHSCQVK
jgi:hypothetical protein